MMTLEDKKNSVINAVEVGMLPEDAYVFAGLSPSEIVIVDNDDSFQRRLAQSSRILENRLLVQMQNIAERQVRMGKEGATAWMLEKLFPRYSSKPQESNVPVTINLSSADPANLDTVSVVKPQESGTQNG